MCLKVVSMEGKIIKPKKAKKANLIESVILFIIGIILVSNSNQIIILGFQVIGICILLYGLHKLFRYINLKKQFKVEDTELLIKSICSITIGFLVVVLASVLETGLRFILGIYLIFTGFAKIMSLQNGSYTSKTTLISGILFLLLGLYTIFVANVALIIIGILLIASSMFDFINYLNSQKKE